jgi:hypothetical protein
MKNAKQTWLLAMFTLLMSCSLANAQNDLAKTENEAIQSSTEASTKASATLMEATQQYKTSSRELLSIRENEVRKGTAKLDELRALVDEGLVAKAELETSEQSLATLRAQLEATQKQITDSDRLIAEIQRKEELPKTQAAVPVPFRQVSKPYGTFATPTMLRYNCAAAWSIGNLSGIQSFFAATFGHALPTSAIGQSATHNQLGYDHRNAVDVALHPDSAEGKTLINYLKNQGIPFLAFRGAIPGVATGPHIHIGSPSHRLS